MSTVRGVVPFSQYCLRNQSRQPGKQAAWKASQMKMRMPPPRFSCWICSFTSSTQTALTTHLRRTHSFRLNPPHRPRYHGGGTSGSVVGGSSSNGNSTSGMSVHPSAAINIDASRYLYGVRVGGPTLAAGPTPADPPLTELSASSMAKPYCPGAYVCQVCKFRSPTGAGLARHAYSHQKTAVCAPTIQPVQPRGATYTQGFGSIVVRELPVGVGHTKAVLYSQQMQMPLATTTTTTSSSQPSYTTDSVRVGGPLNAPLLSSEEQQQQQLQEPVQNQDQSSIVDGELDRTASTAPVSSEPCPDCGCSANGKCGQQTPEPGRILLVSQENLAEVTDPSRPQELFELGADALQPLGGLDPAYIEHVHCEEGLLELHYKPPNTSKTVHLTAVRVHQLPECPEGNDMNEQGEEVEPSAGIETDHQQEDNVSTEKKAEVQADDNNNPVLATDQTISEACFNSAVAKAAAAATAAATEDVDQDPMLQQQIETGEDPSAAAGIPTTDG